MDEEVGRGIFQAIIATLEEKKADADKRFKDNSHGVYRDEVEQFRAEVQFKTLDEIIGIIKSVEETYDTYTRRIQEEGRKARINETEDSGGSG